MSWPRLKQLPNAKIALAFSDPAGANACLAIAKMEEDAGSEVLPVFTNRQPQAPFECHFPVTVNLEAPDFKGMGITCLITGTSHPESSDNFECKCIINAKKENIFTISFIDHWVNFKLRFSALPQNMYPDEIWVVDEAAKNLAILEGLPDEILKIVGNPYHYYLKNNWKSAYNKGEYLTELGIKPTSPVILFAPDPLSLRPGKEVIGFSELEVLTDLLEIIKSNVTQPFLLIKLHPLQPQQGIEEIVNTSGYANCFIVKGANIPELLKEADLVIGFYSNILLEAEALGKEVIRYFPGNPENNLLRHSKVGKLFTHIAALKDCLQQIIKTE